MGIGNHQSAKALKDEWLTPPWILKRLGSFLLDPCAAINQPWATASVHFTKIEDGLAQPWIGRVWLNPPYGLGARRWLDRLAQHGNGIALTFARTETQMFFETVWSEADAILFLRGRLHFHHIDGKRAIANAGAPSVLIAYGASNVDTLATLCDLGKYIKL